MLRYVGDISREDAGLLAGYAARSRVVVEFGVGASTQVIAQSLPAGGHLYTFDTDLGWIRSTERRLLRLGVRERVTVLPYDALATTKLPPVDFVFDDGRDDLRLAFAQQIWRSLKIGGSLLLHDTRRKADIRNVLQLAELFFLEVREMRANEAHDGKTSNITSILKKKSEPYANWNAVEKRSAWMLGAVKEPDEFWEMAGPVQSRRIRGGARRSKGT